MAEYMVATDVLVSKAGPGTIAEAAASLSLPVMLTSFLERCAVARRKMTQHLLMWEECVSVPILPMH